MATQSGRKREGRGKQRKREKEQARKGRREATKEPVRTRLGSKPIHSLAGELFGRGRSLRDANCGRELVEGDCDLGIVRVEQASANRECLLEVLHRPVGHHRGDEEKYGCESNPPAYWLSIAPFVSSPPVGFVRVRREVEFVLRALLRLRHPLEQETDVRVEGGDGRVLLPENLGVDAQGLLVERQRLLELPLLLHCNEGEGGEGGDERRR